MKRMRRKGEKLSGAILISAAIVWGLVLQFGPDTRSNPDPENPPPSATTTPLPASQVTLAPTPVPEPDTILYVVAGNISYRWGLKAVIRGWEKAKYTRLEYAANCPEDAYCVILKEKSLSDKVAAQTLFTTGRIIYVNLNVKVPNPFIAQSAMCHEFGHVLGAGHVIGTTDTCMTPAESYRVLPSRLDLQMVDSLGEWEPEKMYESSGKTVDESNKPK